MKYLDKIYFHSGLTAPVTLKRACRLGDLQRIRVRDEGLVLDMYSRIIVTPHVATPGGICFAVATLVQIESPTEFTIYVKNIDCVREGPIRILWSVFNDSRTSIIEKPIYFFGHSDNRKPIGNMCNSISPTWEHRYYAPRVPEEDVQELAFHTTNRTLDGYTDNVIATACIERSSALEPTTVAFNMEKISGKASFYDGHFLKTDTLGLTYGAYRVLGGTTEAQSFRRREKKSWRAFFGTEFKAVPIVFLTAKRNPGRVSTAVTIPSINTVDRNGFSFTAIDMGCERDTNRYSTQYNWFAVGL